MASSLDTFQSVSSQTNPDTICGGCLQERPTELKDAHCIACCPSRESRDGSCKTGTNGTVIHGWNGHEGSSGGIGRPSQPSLEPGSGASLAGVAPESDSDVAATLASIETQLHQLHAARNKYMTPREEHLRAYPTTAKLSNVFSMEYLDEMFKGLNGEGNPFLHPEAQRLHGMIEENLSELKRLEKELIADQRLKLRSTQYIGGYYLGSII